MARYVEDLELVLHIISGPDGVDPYVAPVELGRSPDERIPGLRVALCTDEGVTQPTKETAEALEAALKESAFGFLSDSTVKWSYWRVCSSTVKE